MPNFTSYTLTIRGTGSGFEPGIRAIATLRDGTAVIGRIRCWDAETNIPSDSPSTPLTMNVPVAMLLVILDVLRHEGPLQIAFNATFGKVLLYTATGEPVGEDEP